MKLPLNADVDAILTDKSRVNVVVNRKFKKMWILVVKYMTKKKEEEGITTKKEEEGDTSPALSSKPSMKKRRVEIDN